MDANSQAINTLANQIIKSISTGIESAPFDKTKSGIVTGVLGGGKYSVKINGTVFTVPSCIPANFSINDNVNVLFKQNDSQEKYITGKVNIEAGDIPEMEALSNLEIQSLMDSVT